MARSNGLAGVRRLIAQLPAELERKVLRGALRAGAAVVAEEAKARSISSELAAAVKVGRTKTEGGRITVRVEVKGDGAYIAPWLEYGTDPHFITVDESERRGMSVRRINDRAKAGSLVINGQFVKSVHHPGARPHPFLRPALDAKSSEAAAAAQSYITSKITRAGIVSANETEGGA